MNVQLHLRMLSDWHTGTGSGRPGDLDAVVVTDDDGLPLLPAKTLHDLLRDACETATSRLVSDWTEWVEWLFGSQPFDAPPSVSPQPGHLFVGAAQLSPSLRGYLRGRPERVAGLFGTRAAAALDPRTGTALPKMLRNTQMARAGVDLMADLSWEGDPLPEPARAALLAGVHLLRGVGGSRRRGYGACATSLPTGFIDPLRAAELLRGEPPSPPRPTHGFAPPSWTAIDDHRDSAATKDYTVHIRLEEDVLVADRTVGNQTVSLDHLPGSVLMPMLSTRFPQLAGRFAEGSARVLPAYPSVLGSRSLPRPRCFAVEKGQDVDTPVVNLLCEQPGTGGQLRRLRGGYVLPHDISEWTDVPVERNVQVFNRVDDATQRPLDDGVFAYETITGGVEFTAILRVTADIDINAGSFSARLGRALRTRGRCWVTVEPHDRVFTSPPASRSFTVWLLSDSLLFDEAFAPAPTPIALAKEIGAFLDTHLSVDHAYVDTVVRNTWHSRWERPRPGMALLAAGSVVRFTSDREVSGDALAALERAGIGERRGEGLGDIVVGHPLLEVPMVSRRAELPAAREPSSPPVPGLSELEATLVAELDRAARLRRVAARLAELAEQDGLADVWPVPPTVSAAQLGTVRSLLLDVHRPGGAERARHWIANARKKVGGRRFASAQLDELDRMLMEPRSIWGRLGLELADAAEDEHLRTLQIALTTVVRSYQQRAEKEGV